LHLQGVTVQRGRRSVLQNLNLAVEPGQSIGIIGGNGSGKSTLLRAIVGLCRCTSGSITVAGHPASAGRHQIGWLSDRPVFPSITVGEVVRIHQRIVHATPQACSARLSRLGLSDTTRDRADQLSSGQTRRLAFALATVHAPPVLLLDEPFTALDERGREQMLEQIQEAVAGGAAVLCAAPSRADLDPMCEALYTLDGGTLESHS
ncbi:MAG: ATP-binding cassette domain-containing protein, partial [Myxococcota bacterium]